MKNVVSTLAFVTGLAALGCGGAKEQAADPSAVSDDNGAERAEFESDGARSSDEETDTTSDAESQSHTEQQDDEGTGDCRQSAAKLALAVDRQSVSLEQGVLEATMDGPICNITMTITRKGGLPKVEKTFRYTGASRELRWNPVPRDQIEKIEIRISADDGAYQGVVLVPWAVTIDHQEVVFDTDKAVIRPSEVRSLEDSFAKIKQVLETVEGKGLGTITLFIAGHTDTRGSDARNLDLSRRRSQAIAAWFMKRGLCIPIASEGFGETALKKMTADEVDAQENRRVDYILAVEPPMIRKGVAPAWKWISKGC
jgi:outer membrane protein OmpA-like peptidoglycan-associated protein